MTPDTYPEMRKNTSAASMKEYLPKVREVSHPNAL
jgi:hypothetical protein